MHEPPMPPGVIEVRAAADAANIGSLRLIAADLAARGDFDLDQIADLRIAVDEACSELVQIASDGANLVCRFRVTDDHIEFTVLTTPRDGTVLSTRTFGWHVLATLVDEASPVQSDGSRGIRLSKQRTEERGA